MKGMLVKDFKLMKGQMRFFVMIVLISAGISASQENGLFVIGYMTFLCAMFTLSSVSYDEFENGNAFLFSLPITRSGYVAEKYGFGILVGTAAWGIATALVLVTGSLKNTISVSETMEGAFLLLPAMVLVISLMLPFQFQFGGEKGRLVILGVFGIVFVLGILAEKIGSFFRWDLIWLWNRISSISAGMFAVLEVGAAALLLLVSYFISTAIMKKKEF